MTLVVTVHVREGIVMASDSRLTLTFDRNVSGAKPNSFSVTSSDSARKLFLTPNRIGISTFGVADVNGTPIAGVIESFIIEKLAKTDLPPLETAKALLAYFKSIGVSQQTNFHVAGYRVTDQAITPEVIYVNLMAGTAKNLVPLDRQGANWGGEIDIFQRLTNQVAIVDDSGNVTGSIPNFQLPFEFFTLQDAIDFSSFAIKATIDTMRFQAREKTVGGPVDIVVITPAYAQWIAQKHLNVP